MIINDTVEVLSNDIDPHTGFLHSKVTICRSGIQEYLGRELGLTGADGGKFFNVLRAPEDVIDENSLSTYGNIPITDEHPNERWVNLDNIKILQRGQVSNISIDDSQEETHIKGEMVITDEELINKVQNGKIEVSLGYAFKLVAEDGEYNGQSYQFKYVDMVANHLSVVSKGRCGESCRIQNDKKHDIIVDEEIIKQGVPVKVKINGKEFEVSEEIVEALKAERSSSTDEMDEIKKKAEDESEEAEKSNDALQAKVDTLQDKMVKANDAKISDKDLNVMITERAKLLSFAQGVMGDAMPDTTCPMQIKKVVCEKHFGKSMDGKSEAYIDARYDIVQEDQIAADSSVKKLATDLEKAKLDKANDNDKIATDARKSYMEKKGMK